MSQGFVIFIPHNSLTRKGLLRPFYRYSNRLSQNHFHPPRWHSCSLKLIGLSDANTTPAITNKTDQEDNDYKANTWCSPHGKHPAWGLKGFRLLMLKTTELDLTLSYRSLHNLKEMKGLIWGCQQSQLITNGRKRREWNMKSNKLGGESNMNLNKLGSNSRY